jgi:WD40 repeat protein
MKLWKTDESEEFPLLSEAYGTSDLATFSPDGLQVLFIHRGERQTAGETVFWDVKNGHEYVRIKSMQICAYMPDGARIVGYDEIGSRILNARDLAEELRFEEGRMYCDKYEIFPDGSRVAALRWDFNGPEWRIWETAQGKIMYYLRVHSLTVSPSGKHLLIRTGDNFVELRDAATGSIMLSYKFFEDLKVLRWSPDGRRIVCGYRSGEVLLLEPQNIKFSVPVATAWEKPKSRWNPLSKEKYAIKCPVCAQWSELPTFSPGEEMDCPKCNQRLALNPFTISGDWRELENKEGGS